MAILPYCFAPPAELRVERMGPKRDARLGCEPMIVGFPAAWKATRSAMQSREMDLRILRPRTPIYCVHFVRDYLPLSLGMIISYARSRLSAEHFDLTVRFIASAGELERCLRDHGPGVFLFSNYIWNVEDHLAASAWIKEHSPGSITIHGGPSVPSYPEACREFLLENRHVDFGARGEGEKTTVELLTHLATSESSPESICGLSFLVGEKLVQTPPRERSANPDEFPSPYLTGVFDGIYQHAIYAILETNRGCPYGCTFCDWGSATLQKVRRFSLKRVSEEIRWMSEHRMRDISIADANFGIFPRDVEICRMVCEAKARTGFPERALVNYAKNTHKDVVDIVEMMTNAGLISSGTISIQTRDPQTLTAIRRRNIKTQEYEKLQAAFSVRQLPLDSQLMLGLPGSTLESFKEDLRFYFFKDVNVRVFRTVLLPNSPMAEPSYRARYRIATDEGGTIIATSTLSMEQLRTCDDLARLFRCAHGYGMLRYLLSHLFWDHSIDPISYLERLLYDMAEGPQELCSQFPLLRELCIYDELNESAIAELKCASKDVDPANRAASPRQMIPATHIRFRERLRQGGTWNRFYEELRAYTCSCYRLANSSALKASLAAQEALMPTLGRSYPHVVNLAHDYVRYYREHMELEGDPRPLAAYPPGFIGVEDPLNLSQTGTYRQDWTLTDFWQLYSPLPGAGRSTLRRLVEELRKEDLGPIASLTKGNVPAGNMVVPG